MTLCLSSLCIAKLILQSTEEEKSCSNKVTTSQESLHHQSMLALSISTILGILI